MARNRVIYQSEAIFVSDNAASTTTALHEQLQRVQSANYSFSVNRQDINHFGQLSRVDSLILDNPTVSFDISYYLGAGFNETALGFNVNRRAAADSSFASGHMQTSSGKNFYIITVGEGFDAKSAQETASDGVVGAGASVIALGNAYLTDYTLDASVGSIPSATVSFECANITAGTGISGVANGSVLSGISLPSIKQEDGDALGLTTTIPGISESVDADEPTALRAGDVEVSFSSAAGDPNDGPMVFITGSTEGAGSNGAYVQSASLSVPLSRTPLEKLGSRFPFARTVDFPVNASLSLSAIVNEITSFDLQSLMTGENSAGFDITVKFKDNDAVSKFEYTLKGAQLDSESFGSSIGANKSVDLTFSAPIGAIDDTSKNILASGDYSTVPFA